MASIAVAQLAIGVLGDGKLGLCEVETCPGLGDHLFEREVVLEASHECWAN
ncbi:conserved hypothetical protein [Ricinus communis]|uniref:Uncharacterized protein n=1 Tax=Ricinus communis TaxID=3988 RepID=B9SPN1_RICCO|nr:conserved hypothetical protein [Ricinus communis]